jgi:biotin---protein ligase
MSFLPALIPSNYSHLSIMEKVADEPRFAPANLSKSSGPPSFTDVVNAIASTDATRLEFMRLSLRKLGLKVNEDEQAVPPLSRLHLSAHQAADISNLVAGWSEIITVVDDEDYVKGGNDVFLLEKEGGWGLTGLKEAVEKVLPETASGSKKEARERDEDPKIMEIRDRIEYSENAPLDGILDYDKIIKKVVLHQKYIPTTHEVPTFHHESYYANLVHYHQRCGNQPGAFGKHLMYPS